VVGERHIALAEFENFLLVDADAAEFMHGAWDVVFKIAVIGAVLNLLVMADLPLDCSVKRDCALR